MGWFTKQKEVKQKELPPLPELPSVKDDFDFQQRLQDMQASHFNTNKSDFSENLKESSMKFSGFGVKNELPPLPSFPSSQTGDNITRDAVKQAIRPSQDYEVSEEIEEPPQNIKKVLTLNFLDKTLAKKSPISFSSPEGEGMWTNFFKSFSASILSPKSSR